MVSVELRAQHARVWNKAFDLKGFNSLGFGLRTVSKWLSRLRVRHEDF